jgi:hypothetical protein
MWLPWKQASPISQPFRIGPVHSRCLIRVGYKNVCLTDSLLLWLMLTSEVTIIHGTLPDFGHSLMTKSLYRLKSFFPASNWTPSLNEGIRSPLTEMTSHRSQRLFLAEGNNIEMDEISLMTLVMPAKGAVKFHETPPSSSTTQTARPSDVHWSLPWPAAQSRPG